MEIAWQEYHYRELYDAFKPVISAELVNQVHALLLTTKERKAQKIKATSAKTILTLVEKDALAFYEKAIEFAAREHTGKKKAKPLPPAAKQLATFKKELTAIVKAVPKLTKPLEEPDYEKLIAKLSKATTAADFLYAGALAHNEGLLLLICHALVEKIAGMGLARRWAFDRKLHEFLKEAGADTQHVWNFFSRAFALAAEKQPTLAGKQTEKDAAYLLASRLTDGQDAWLLTEAHWFDNVKWFNKELTDSSLFLAIAIPLLTAAKAKQTKLLALYKTLAKAKDKAAYHCEAFVMPFAPKPAKKPKPAAKAPAKKTAATKEKVPATKTKKPADKKK